MDGRLTGDEVGARDAEAWTRAHAALDLHVDGLRRTPGILGGGLGWRRGMREACILLSLGQDFAPAEAPARLEGPLGAVAVETIRAGEVHRHLSVGARVGCWGLGAGQGWGTLGLIARDQESGRSVAVTAMHVISTAEEACNRTVRIHAIDRAGEAPQRLGVLLRGTTTGVDAAAVRLRRGKAVSAFLPGVGSLSRCRTPGAADMGTRVRFYGAGSGFREGRIAGVAQRFFQDRLDDAFLVEMSCRAGDSGGACCDDDGAVLGLHVGALRASPHLQVFCAAEAALRALNCELCVSDAR